jgi:hypothetical protein
VRAGTALGAAVGVFAVLQADSKNMNKSIQDNNFFIRNFLPISNMSSWFTAPLRANS